MKEIPQSTKLEGHVNYLQRVHDDLDKEIQEKFAQYGDDSSVQTLKKKKLRVKDEIETLTKYMETLG